MRSAALWLAILVLAGVRGSPAEAAGRGAPIVFFDIAGPDTGRLKAFYGAIFNWPISPAMGIETPNLEGTLRQDPPAALIYVGVPDIDATLAKIKLNGGRVLLAKTVVPTVATFAIFKDPAGNAMGLVEIKPNAAH